MKKYTRFIKISYRIQAFFSNVSIFYPRTDFTRWRRNIPLRFKIFTRARVRIVSAKFPMAPGQTVQTEEKIFTDWRRGTILSKISSIDSIKIYQELSIVQISIIYRPIVHTPRDILIIRNKIFHLRIYHRATRIVTSFLPFRFIHPGQCARHPTPSLCAKAWLVAIPKAFRMCVSRILFHLIILLILHLLLLPTYRSFQSVASIGQQIDYISFFYEEERGISFSPVLPSDLG